jgi:hypothetical protein
MVGSVVGGAAAVVLAVSEDVGAALVGVAVSGVVVLNADGSPALLHAAIATAPTHAARTAKHCLVRMR